MTKEERLQFADLLDDYVCELEEKEKIVSITNCKLNSLLKELIDDIIKITKTEIKTEVIIMGELISCLIGFGIYLWLSSLGCKNGKNQDKNNIDEFMKKSFGEDYKEKMSKWNEEEV